MARLPSRAGPGLVCYTAVVQPLGAVLSHGAAPVCPGQWHSKMEAVAPLGIDACRKEEGWGASHGSKTGNLSKRGASASRWEEQRFLSIWKGDLARV